MKQHWLSDELEECWSLRVQKVYFLHSPKKIACEGLETA